MKVIVFFDEARPVDADRVGAKAANLIALTAAGFPVPGGFALTTDAWSLFASGCGDLLGGVADLDRDHPDRLQRQCEELRSALRGRSLPAVVERDVRIALERLGADRPVAVRSSCTAEDTAGGASAGQYDSFLGCRGAASVLEAIRECYLSLWSPHAVAYRYRMGIPDGQARMAVAVQVLVDADAAGVGFTVDPVAGRVDRMVVDANYGLGESVVGGEHDVDHLVLDKATLATVSRRVADKATMVVRGPDGVCEIAVPEERRARPVLGEEQVRALAGLLARVEAHFGWPQDVEWAFEGETLWLLQSRPVTAVEPRWTRDESAERFPGPIRPLSWDFMQETFRRSLAHSLDLMGLPRFTRDWFDLFDHHVYGDQNAVQLLGSFRPIRARSLAELEAELPDLARRFAWVAELPEEWDRSRARYLMRLGALAAVDADAAGPEELWRHLVALGETASDYFRPNIAISMTQAMLHRALFGLVALLRGPERAAEEMDALLAGCETRTAAVNRDLHRLAERLDAAQPLADELLASGGEALWRSGRVDDFPAFAAALRELLQEHGHRELDMDFLQPTWSAAPWIVLDTLAAMRRGGPREDPAAAARRQQQRSLDAETWLLEACPAGLRLFARELLRLARAYTVLDDLEHYETTRMNPIARRLAIALGRHLEARGFVAAPEDVFLLRKHELAAWVGAGLPGSLAAESRQRAKRAADSLAACRTQPPPWTRDAALSVAPPESRDSWRGVPGSPGQVTAACFRVEGPEAFARVPGGSVLVVRTTGPAWTPLFYSAVGLVAETGGPLSHGAVTAREMRLPAVMAVRGALAALRSGERVHVDGSRGLVSRQPD